MGMQTSDGVANAQLDAIETTVGTAPLLRFYSGTAPANCAAAATGTLLAEITLPSDWMAGAASRSKGIANGPWVDSSANASGLVGYYRMLNSAGSTCHLQGLVGENWQASKAYLLNQQVINGGNLYRCITAGTSASSGGPTGTGADITDGTAHWAHVGTAEMTIDNGNIVATQQVSISAYNLTHPGNA